MRSLVSPRNGFWLLLIISLAFNAGFGTTFGVRTYRHYCRGGGHGGGTSLGSLHEKLNLTPEQEARMNAAREELLQEVDELRRELSVETEALAELVTAPEPDRAAIAAQLGNVASLREQIQQRVVEHFLELKRLLGPDQREGFDEIIRRHIFRHGGHGGHGHGSLTGAHGCRSRSDHEAERTSDENGG
ncbi:MAG: Spy/CpxP family protein refolding chaperone [Phycisphaerae bacterium]